MTRYYVYYLRESFSCTALNDDGNVLPPFDSAEEAVRWAKKQIDDTDGTGVYQIIGFGGYFEDCTPVYTKTIVGKRLSNGTTRGRVL